MKFLVGILIYVLSTSPFAQEVYPKGCIPWSIHKAIPTLKTNQPTILMLHNLTTNDLWVTRPASDQGAQAGFSSLMNTGKWSSLALNRNKTKLAIKCIESKPGHEQEISCADALAICKWSKTQFPKAEEGIYWAAENMNLAPLIAFLGRQGYVLH